MDNMETTRNKMTYKEAERIVKSEMCKKCGIYLGGGKCDKDCRVIQCIEALSNKENEDKKGTPLIKEDIVPFDLELYQAGLMDMPKEMIKVLDNIRAEIIQVANEEKVHDEKWTLGLKYATKIIDKYKAESEG